MIGIAVFTEARPIHYELPSPPIATSRDQGRSSAKAAVPAAAAAAAESMARDSSWQDRSSSSHDQGASDQAAQGLGTGHGAREWSPVARTGFVRASKHPAQVSQWRYDDEATLVAHGVLPRYRQHRRDDRPRAFPQGFVADPPRW